MKRPPRGGAKWPFWKKKIEFSYFAVACRHHVVDATSEPKPTVKFKLKVCLLQTNKNWRHQWRHFWIIDDRWPKPQILILAIFWPLNFLGNDNDNFDACITDAWTVLIHASKLWLPLPIKCWGRKMSKFRASSIYNRFFKDDVINDVNLYKNEVFRLFFNWFMIVFCPWIILIHLFEPLTVQRW